MVRRFLSLAVSVLMLLTVTLTLATRVMAAEAQHIIVFTASWCASCRDLMPVVERVASERGIPILLIDVDEPNSPKTAKQYGLSIPTKELPQIYMAHGTKNTTLLYDGQNYLLGQRRAAQLEIQNRLGQLASPSQP